MPCATPADAGNPTDGSHGLYVHGLYVHGLYVHGRVVEAHGVSDRSSPAAVVARSLTKRFGAIAASSGVSITLPRTGICGLLGPNGAGKTTLLRMIAGVLPADGGELTVLGFDARRDGGRIRPKIGYLPESAPLYPELTVLEYLRYRANLVGLSGRAADAAIRTALGRCDVLDLAARCCGTLSKGMQQRVGLAATIVGEPAIVILDEPSVGLDPAQMLVFRRLIRELGADRLVILSSHLLSEVESLCGSLAVMAGGRVLVHESIAAFRARAADARRIVIEIERSIAGDAGMAAEFGPISETALDDGWIRAEFAADRGDRRADLARALAARGICARSIGFDTPGLERAFIELVRGAQGETHAGSGGSR